MAEGHRPYSFSVLNFRSDSGHVWPELVMLRAAQMGRLSCCASSRRLLAKRRLPCWRPEVSDTKLEAGASPELSGVRSQRAESGTAQC